MGGFTEVKEDGTCYVVIKSEELGERLKDGKINISEKEIADKGRGDAVSKGIVVFQTTWVILQCIARQVQHLPITELEIVTIAYAGLNFVTYSLWWYKPQNVGCPVLLCDHETMKHLCETKKQESGSGSGAGNGGASTKPLWSVVTEKAKEAKKAKKPWWPRNPCQCETCPATMDIVDIKNIACALLSLVLVVPLTRGFILFGRLMGNIDDELTPRMEKIIKGIFGARYYCQFGRIWGHLHKRDSPLPKDPSGERAPTFYAGERVLDTGHWIDKRVVPAAVFGFFIAIGFGGIHCLAWSFEFPSHLERLLWRSASLTITCAPVLLAIHPLWLWGPKVYNVFDVILFLIYVGAGFSYLLSRLLLLVLPFLCLRSLPAEAYQNVQWTRFVPGIF